MDSDGEASDQEIRRLMVELVRRERAATRAARRAQRADRDVAMARMNLALRAVCGTTEMEQQITPDLILPGSRKKLYPLQGFIG